MKLWGVAPVLLAASMALASCSTNAPARVSTLSAPEKICGVPTWFGAQSMRIHLVSRTSPDTLSLKTGDEMIILRYARTCSSDVRSLVVRVGSGRISIRQVVRDPKGHVIAVRLRGIRYGPVTIVATKTNGSSLITHLSVTGA